MPEVPVQIKRLILEQRLTPFLQQKFDKESEIKVTKDLIKEGVLKKADNPLQPIIQALAPIEAQIKAWTRQLDALPHPVCKVAGCEAKADRLVLDQDFCEKHAKDLVEFVNRMQPIKGEQETPAEPTESPANGKRDEPIGERQ
jgi:hypothetical protein